MITYDIHVLMGANANEIKTTVKCHDTGVNLRVFPETLNKLSARRSMTEPYTIPSGSVAVLKVLKSDGTYVLTDAKQVDKNSAFFELNPQTFTVAGKASAEVNIFGPDGRRVTSGTFIIDVSQECADNSAEESKIYVDVMAGQIQAAIDAADRAEEAAKQATSGGATDEQLAKAIKKYFEDNPDQSGYTAKIAYVKLLADSWQGDEELYSQIVAVDGVTANSQVDLTPNAEQLVALRSKDLTFVTKNANGVITVYAIGQKPQNDYTIQVTITEVAK